MNTLTTNNIAAQPAYLTELRNLRGGRLTKVNGITTSLAPLATAVILTFATAGAMAQYSVGTGNPTTVGALAISANAAANAAGTNSIAIGENAAATGDESIAIGTNSMTTDAKAIAIGLESAAGTGSVALGTAAKAESEQAVAIGNSANAQGINATAIGSGANALEVKSTALGYGAYATAEYAVALGAEAAASASNSVALGSGSQAGANSATAYLVNAKNTSGGAVSVGASGSERQITNVAPGLNDTDAVNVEQLKAVSSAGLTTSSATGGTVTNGGTFVNATIANGAGVYNAATAYGESAVAGADFATAFGSGSRASSVASVAIGVATSAEGEFSIAIGSAIAQDSGSIAIGHNALVELEYGVAIGDGAVAQKNTVSLGRNAESVLEGSVAIGYGTLAGYADSVALGSNSVTSAKGAAGTEFLTADALVKATNSTTLGAVSVGSATANRQIQNVAAGTLNDDAANVAQVKAVVSTVGAAALTTSSGTGLTYGQAGFTNAKIDNAGVVYVAATAYGESAVAGAAEATAFGTGAKAIGTNSTALGQNAVTSGAGNATAVGADSSAAIGGTAVGRGATATGSAVAMGNSAQATGANSVAIGEVSKATQTRATAVGEQSEASGVFATALGHSSLASGQGAIAIGDANAAGSYAVAVGYGSNVATLATNSTAVGVETKVSGAQSIALGGYSQATGSNSVALGYGAGSASATTGLTGNIAIGFATGQVVDTNYNIGIGHSSGRAVTLGGQNVALGYEAGNVVAGSHNTSVGRASGSAVTGSYNDSIGYYAGYLNTGNNNVSIGRGANYTATDLAFSNAVAVGSATRADSDNIAIGTAATALYSGLAGSVSIGKDSDASGGGVALGRLAQGTGYISAAIGYGAEATAARATAVGSGAISNADSATALGYSSTASAAYAIAIGNADATAADSIAVGRSATASGVSTIAMGHNSTASGGNAVALGAGSFAKGNSDTVIGSNAGADNAGGITYRENTYIGTASGQGGTSTGATAVGFYSGRNVSGLHNTAIGDYSASTVTGNYNIGVGYEAGNNNGNATTASHANVGIGYRSGKDVTGNHSVSMGSLSGSNNVGSFNVSIGTESNYDAANAGAYGNVVAVGYQSSARFNNATALGYSALAGATNSIAIGDATTNATDAVAMGRGAIANNASDVALGKGSTSAAVANTTTATVMGANTATFAGSAAASTLSVGAVGTERTLTNVAAGRVTATSTDGINGSQLFGVANVIDTKMDTQGAVIASALGGGSTYTAGTNVLTAPTFTHVNANNITGGGASSTSVGGAVAVLDAALGSLNAINNDQNTAISQLATSNATNSLAYDYLRNSVTVDGYRLGDDPSAMPIGGNERGTTALGAGSQAHHGEFNTAVGSNAIAIGRSQQTGIGNNTAIGAQASTFDIQNGGFEIGGATAVGSNAKAWAENSTAIGFGSDVRNIDVISTQPLIGGTAIGQGAIVEHSNAISIGTFSTSAVNTDEAFLVKRLNPGFGALSIGGVDPGTGEIVTRQIKNVAPGLERTDAVNVEQLSVVYDQANSAAQQASYAQQGLQGVANAIGGGASYNYAGTFTAPNFRPNLNNATTLSGLTGVPASAAVSTVANAFGRVDAALGAINTTNLAQTAAISQLASGTGATTPFTLNAPTGGTTIQLSTASAAVTTLNLANGANPITVTGVKDGAATNDAVNFGQLSAVKTTADNTQTFLVGAGTYAAPAAGSFVAQTNTVNSAVNNATTGLAATNLIANTAATAAANANTSLSTVATVLGTTIDPLTGAMTNPSYSVTNTAGTTSSVNNLGDAISTLEAVNNAQSTALTSLSSGTSANTPFVVSGTTIGLSTSGMPATSLNLAGTAGDITVTGVKAGVANNDAVNFAQLSAVKTTADTTAATVNNATTGLAATKAIADAATAAATNANTGLGSVATALGGGAMYNAATGALTPPSYSVTNTAGTTSSVNNLGDAISTLNTVNNDQSTALTNLGNGTSGVFVVDSATGNAVLNSTLVGAAKAVDMGNRTVTGVNNGVANSDAVNFGQLTAAANTAKSFSTSLGATTAAALGGATAYDAVNNTMAASFTLANAGAVGTNNGAPFTTVDAALQALDTVNATQDTKLGDLQQNVTNLGNGSTGVMVKDAATGNAVLNGALIAPTAAVDMGNRTVTGVKAGAAGLDAVNFTQLSATNSGVNSLAMALGGNYNSSTGAIAGLPTSYTVNGQTHSSITGALTAVSSTVSSLAAAAGPTINGGAASTPFTTNGSTITVAASGSTATTVNFANANTTNAGGTMTLTGVAAGVNATDAVNVSQLAALKGDVNQAIATATGSTTGQAVFTQASAAGEVKVNAGINASAVNMGNLAVTGVKNASLTATSTEAVNGSQLNETNQALDTYKTSNDARLADLGSSVGTLSGTVAENAKKAAAGTAMAIATVHAVNAAPAPGKVQVGVGLGTQDGQTALAFGINGTSASGRYGFSGSVSAGTSINKPKVGAGVGVRFVFD